jgi:deazaflavin-dependent oxidoreductase (nitroreductase family)
MAKTYRATLGMRIGNLFTSTLLRAGVKLGRMSLLTVRGRTSGEPRTTPVTIGEYEGQRYLLAPFGAVHWVRNLRAAGTAVLTRGPHAEPIAVVELSATEAAPVLRYSLARAPSFIRSYFDVTPESPLEDFEREAPRHPVFLVK